MPRTIGIVPARMASSRFPGKPLHPILGRPMLEHCFERARLFDGWDDICVATCDTEIREFCDQKEYPVVMTSDTHVRALDRVAEAMGVGDAPAEDDDIIVAVQADEPLLNPEDIRAVVQPLRSGQGHVEGTILAIPIVDETVFRDPNSVKIIHDLSGRVLYTSRSPVPHCTSFDPSLGAKRIGGIFGFRRSFLTWFTNTDPSPLEINEACDSNRICDNGRHQHIAEIPYRPFFSVDSPQDVAVVEAAMPQDSLSGKY